jgi:hypothetical protein
LAWLLVTATSALAEARVLTMFKAQIYSGINVKRAS